MCMVCDYDCGEHDAREICNEKVSCNHYCRILNS